MSPVAAEAASAWRAPGDVDVGVVVRVPAAGVEDAFFPPPQPDAARTRMTTRTPAFTT
jgi:hypothetical protein